MGDINGDGASEFVAGWNGLEFFDRHGSKLGAQPWDGSLHQVEVVDVDGDRKNEIIHGNGNLIIRNGQGQIIKEVEMPFYLSNFDLCAMPGEERPQILAVADENIWITDFDGKVFEKLAASLSKFDRPPKKPGEETGQQMDFMHRNCWWEVVKQSGAITLARMVHSLMKWRPTPNAHN